MEIVGPGGVITAMIVWATLVVGATPLLRSESACSASSPASSLRARDARLDSRTPVPLIEAQRSRIFASTLRGYPIDCGRTRYWSGTSGH